MLPVICDALTVTTPVDLGPSLQASLTDIALRLPEAVLDPQGVRVGRHGLVRFAERHGVLVASASGTVMASLRAADLLADYVAAVAEVVTYKVSHLDLAQDRVADCAALLPRIYRRYKAKGAGLTRKRIPPADVTKMFSPGIDGRDTGTVFLGHRKRHETTAIFYDREHDAIRKGKPNPGKLLRLEIRTGRPGMSLRDVMQPEPLFYDLASPDLVRKPDQVPSWEPYGEGFSLTRDKPDPLTALARLVDCSPDLTRMLDQAALLPGEGYDVLLAMVRSRSKRHRATREFTALNGQRDSEAVGRPSDSDLDQAADLDS